MRSLIHCVGKLCSFLLQDVYFLSYVSFISLVILFSFASKQKFRHQEEQHICAAATHHSSWKKEIPVFVSLPHIRQVHEILPRNCSNINILGMTHDCRQEKWCQDMNLLRLSETGNGNPNKSSHFSISTRSLTFIFEILGLQLTTTKRRNLHEHRPMPIPISLNIKPAKNI